MVKNILKFNEVTDEYFGTYLKFKESSDESFAIINNDEELIGHLDLIRVGAWMSWCLLLENDCYLSAGCQDEVREMTRHLNNKNKEKKDESQIL